MSKLNTIKRLIDSLPIDIKRKTSMHSSHSMQQVCENDRTEYYLLQTSEELHAISSSYDNVLDLDGNVIDRLKEKINIYKTLEDFRRISLLGPVHMIFIDADGFTLINAKYGRAAGDVVINIIEKLAQEVFGNKNVFYWGGDELVVLLDALYESDSIQESQKLCRMIRAYNWDEITPELFVTVSIGVAKCQVSEQGCIEETVDWFERAIIGSSFSKRNGGNQAMMGPIIGYRARQKCSNLTGAVDSYKDYQWPIPEICYISSECS